MKNLFSRFTNQLQADFYNFMDKKESKNPIALLNQYVQQADLQTKETGKLLERQGKLKQALEKELAETSVMIEKRTEQLALAKTSGEDDLILFAEQEVAAYEARKVAILSSIDAAMQNYFELERKFELMKHKIKDMKVRQLQLMSKENVTRAHYHMDKMITANEETSDKFDYYQDYIEGLSTSSGFPQEMTTFESRLAQLEKLKKINNPVE